MKTIGDLLKEARVAKGLSKHELEEMTHIKATFIDAIEEANWEKLPEFNIVIGFVKSITHFINVDERQAVSLLRRDYPPLKQKIEQKKPKKINTRFFWGPRLTFLAGIIIILLIVLGYLGFQYKKFNSAPFLVINEPVEGQMITGHEARVSGKTDPDATILVNDQGVVVDNNGNFTTQIEILSTTKEIKVVAKSRSGKETTLSRTIKP